MKAPTNQRLSTDSSVRATRQGFGVVVVPRENAEEVLTRLDAFKEKNREYFAGVKRGVFSNKWVDDLLDESGCIITP